MAPAHKQKWIWRAGSVVFPYTTILKWKTFLCSILFFLNLFGGTFAGELQFAFVCFLIGNVYDTFEHWKKLLNLLCRSEDAIAKHHSLFSNLISILYHQLSEIPADFFVDIVSQDNFLTSTLQVRKLLSVVLHVGKWSVENVHKNCTSMNYGRTKFLKSKIKMRRLFCLFASHLLLCY